MAQGPSAQGHLIAEADGSTGATTREYNWLPSNDNSNDTMAESLPQLAGGGAGTAEGVFDLPLAVIEGTTLIHIHSDHLGRPIRMTDAAKATVWQATYKPFGEVQSITGTLAQNLRFPGQYFQIETGLAYNHHRTYDAITGRYTQPDPLRFVDGPNMSQIYQQFAFHEHRPQWLDGRSERLATTTQLAKQSAAFAYTTQRRRGTAAV